MGPDYWGQLTDAEKARWREVAKWWEDRGYGWQTAANKAYWTVWSERRKREGK
jgi:hypothetical protein